LTNRTRVVGGRLGRGGAKDKKKPGLRNETNDLIQQTGERGRKKYPKTKFAWKGLRPRKASQLGEKGSGQRRKKRQEGRLMVEDQS